MTASMATARENIIKVACSLMKEVKLREKCKELSVSLCVEGLGSEPSYIIL